MADRFNYLAPVMKCQLEGMSGTVLDFTSWSSSYSTKSDVSVVKAAGAALAGAAPGGAAKPVNYPYLTQLSVTLMGMGIDAARGAVMTNTISLTIEPPYQQWVDLIEDYIDVFTIGTVVRVHLGYSGEDGGFLSKEFAGTLTVANVDLSADFVSMTIQAQGDSWWFTRRQGAISTEGMTILDVIRKILDSHGAKLYYLDDQSNETRLSGGPPAYLSSLSNTISEVLNGDDYQLLLELIQGHANYDFYMVGNKVIIYNQSNPAKQGAVPTFVFRGGPSKGAMPIEKGVYPCLTFSNANTQSVIKRGAAKVEAQYTDLDTKTDKIVTAVKEKLGLVFHRKYGLADVVEEALGPAASLTLPIAIGDDTVAMSKPHRDDHRGLYVPVGDSDPSAESKLIGLKRMAEGLSGLESSWSTLGNPLILPGQNVRVLGVSRLFEGRYEVSKVVHSGSLSGYETQIDGKTMGRSAEETPGAEDTSKKVPQAAEAESLPAGPGIDTQIKKP